MVLGKFWREIVFLLMVAAVIGCIAYNTMMFRRNAKALILADQYLNQTTSHSHSSIYTDTPSDILSADSTKIFTVTSTTARSSTGEAAAEKTDGVGSWLNSLGR